METVPCSKCVECKARRISGWSFRLMQEAKLADSSYFITLTYDVDHVHITPSGFMGLKKRDLQLFFKRLRKAKVGNGYSNIRYFAVGEYGGKGYRPHFHVIVFNAPLVNFIGARLCDQVERGTIQLDGKFQFKSELWPHGAMTIGQVCEASVGYTMKYISKPSRIPLHRNDDRVPEFALMSKRLGEMYLTPKMRGWHLDDVGHRMYCTVADGKKISMPRYYKDRIYDDGDRKVAKTISLVELEARKLADQQKAGKNYYRNKSEAHFAANEAAVRKQNAEQTKLKNY